MACPETQSSKKTCSGHGDVCPNPLQERNCCPSCWECCQQRTPSCQLLQGLPQWQRPSSTKAMPFQGWTTPKDWLQQWYKGLAMSAPWGTTLIEYRNLQSSHGMSGQHFNSTSPSAKPTSFHRCRPLIYVLHSSLWLNIHFWRTQPGTSLLWMGSPEKKNLVKPNRFP